MLGVFKSVNLATEFCECGVTFIFFCMSVYVYACVCVSVSVYMSSRKSSEEDHGLVKCEKAESDTVTPPHEEVVHVHCRVCRGFVTEAFIQLLTFVS